MHPQVILVLGGTGFVGSHLCARLVAEGHSVRVLTRNTERARHLRVLPGLELVAGDVHDPATLAATAWGCDALINLVGILNERGRSGAGFMRAHAELASHVVAACRSSAVPRLLHMSGLPAAVDGPSHYLRSKGIAEQTIRAAADHLAWTIFRPSVIFGPGDSFLNRFADLLRLLPVLPLARIDAQLSPVYVGDVVTAFSIALGDARTVGQSYDLGGPHVMTLGETVRYVRDRLGLRRWIFGLPDGIGALQAAVMELLPGKPLSLDNFRSLSVPSVCANDGFGRLGITPTPLDAVVPVYFGQARRHAQFDELRRRRPVG